VSNFDSIMQNFRTLKTLNISVSTSSFTNQMTQMI